MSPLASALALLAWTLSPILSHPLSTNDAPLTISNTTAPQVDTYYCYDRGNRIELTYGGSLYDYGTIYKGALTRFVRQVDSDVAEILRPYGGDDIHVPNGVFDQVTKRGASMGPPLQLKVKQDSMLPEDEWLGYVDIRSVCACLEEYKDEFRGPWIPGAFVQVYHEDMQPQLLIATGKMWRMKEGGLEGLQAPNVTFF